MGGCGGFRLAARLKKPFESFDQNSVQMKNKLVTLYNQEKEVHGQLYFNIRGFKYKINNELVTLYNQEKKVHGQLYFNIRGVKYKIINKP
jgi:hypothetical protein